MLVLYINLKHLKKNNQFNTKLNNLKQKIKKPIKIINQKEKKKLFTLLKSPHVNKKAREQFIFSNYNKTFTIQFSNFFCLINFLFLIKNVFNEKFLIHFKIVKCL